MDSWTNKYIRIPFTDKGRSENGCDCWGLVRLIYKQELNIDLPLLLGYKDTLDRPTIAEICNLEKTNWVEIPFGKEKPYDVIVLNILGFPMHVGVVFNNSFMIHCIKGSGTVVVNYRSAQWIKRVSGFYRYDNTQNKTSSV